MSECIVHKVVVVGGGWGGVEMMKWNRIKMKMKIGGGKEKGKFASLLINLHTKKKSNF